jgi:hypothetical protein
MNREIRAFILFFLTPGKIKIYLIILIILAIYALYYRYSMKNDITSSPQTVESFHNKNLKANLSKKNEADRDEDSIIEPDMRASQYAGETINDNTEDINNHRTNITKIKKQIIDNFINTDNDTDANTSVNQRKAIQTDNTRYKEEIAKTYKELALAEDSKLQAYNRAFNDYLEAQRLNKLNVNIADIGNSIEGGILDIFQTIQSRNSSVSKVIPDTTPTTTATVTPTISTNTFKDVKPSVSKGAEDIIEGFVVVDEETNKKNKKKQNDSSSENILLYILEVITDFITNFDTSRITYYLQNYKDLVNILTREENLIPAGVLMMIISMSLYFIDITS